MFYKTLLLLLLLLFQFQITLADEITKQDDFREQYNLARDYYEQKKYTQAIEVLEKNLIELQTTNKLFIFDRNKIEVFSLFNLAVAYFMLANDEKEKKTAIQNIEKTIAIYQEILYLPPNKVKFSKKIIQDSQNNLLIAKKILLQNRLKLQQKVAEENQKKAIPDLIKEIKLEEQEILKKIEIVDKKIDTFETQQARDLIIELQIESKQKFELTKRKIAEILKEDT